MIWTLWEYRNVFSDFYRSCDEDTRGSIDSRLDQLLTKGNQAKAPISKPLGDGIFELRAKACRFLYYFQPGRRIIVVVAFIKDQSRVPPEQIEKAKEIRKIIEAEKEKVSGIHLTH